MNREAGLALSGGIAGSSAQELSSPIEVEVVYAPVGAPVDCTRLQVASGSTLRGVLEASGVTARHGLVLDELDVGVWGRRASLHCVLRERDRVEIYRPLQCDPKEARRRRYRRQANGRTGVEPEAG
ncbi:MAG: hypothetical protein RI988_939 [Pseudomonadota bacterium]|jgi:putative ubiquitin-RnfH superfamily antitoxin RatB of RatAB toxin-antitoxin module